MTTVRGWTPRRRWLGRTAIFNKNRNVVVILRQNSALVWGFIGVEIYGGRKVRAVLINNYHSTQARLRRELVAEPCNYHLQRISSNILTRSKL